MKILTKEEEQEHYNATLKGGIGGGLAGLAFGGLAVVAAQKRYPAFRQLTLPLRAFLVTSSGTFSAIIAADSYSRRFEESRNPAKNYKDQSTTLQQQAESQKSTKQRTMDWLSKNRYSVVFGSWVASMGTALGIVGRNPYLTGQQKLVQARVYAQGLTIAVVIISLAFETNDSRAGQGRWETVQVLDESDPAHKKMVEKKVHHERYQGEDQWRDMVEAEEQRIKEREEAVKEQEQKDRAKKLNGSGKSKKPAHKPDLEHGKPEEAKAEEVNAP